MEHIEPLNTDWTNNEQGILYNWFFIILLFNL